MNPSMLNEKVSRNFHQENFFLSDLTALDSDVICLSDSMARMRELVSVNPKGSGQGQSWPLPVPPYREQMEVRESWQR